MTSTFSIDGVISGLKTADIIGQLMTLERRPIQLLQAQQEREQVRLKGVQSVRWQVQALQSALAKLLDRAGLNAKTVATDTPTTSPAVLTATAGADAVNGSFKVTVSQLATATRVLSSGPIGQVVNRTATLANAGFRITPVTTKEGSPATFKINGVTISVDDTTTLDDGTANSLLSKINAAGAGVTASLIADADGRANNRVQLVSAAGQSIQAGSLADTSNLLRVLGLADATVQGNTAATVTSGVAAAGALNTSITINDVATTINQANGAFTAAQNAAFIAGEINGTVGSAVTAVDNGDGTFSLTQKTLGSQQVINVSAAGTGTGLTAATTQNGTDKVVGTTSLGVADIGKQLADARLVTSISGLDGGGNGAFALNGTTISYKATDSITAIVNRINASNAGATAFYDPVQDRLRLSAGQTGARTITLADTTGNFLAATGVLSATQTLGQNASFSIDAVNGGQTLTSSSNTVTGYVPGVTLELKTTSATPVTVTVSQDTAATVGLAGSFVTVFNKLLDTIAAQTKYDSTTRQASALTGDSGVLDVERMLRSLTSGAALGVAGSYQNLASLGISTGVTGSTVGTTNRLVLDGAKLTAALKDNPQAVETVIAGFLGSVGSPSGASNLTTVSGSPTNQHEEGTYYVNVLDTSGTVEVRFVTTDGRQLMKTSGTLTAGADNTSLIPGVRLRANGSLVVGEDSFSLTVSTRGVGVRMNDYLQGLLGVDGFFEGREDASEAVTSQLTKRIEDSEVRLKVREEMLTRKFAGLEAALARLQSQSSALLSQIAQLPRAQ